MATKKKHVSFPQQREQCRLNKFTYIEKVGSLKEPVLFCNYPFPDPTHKKGLCKASLCTDMREIPDDILAADDKELEPVDHKDEAGDDNGAEEGKYLQDGQFTETAEAATLAAKRQSMKPEDIAKSA